MAKDFDQAKKDRLLGTFTKPFAMPVEQWESFFTADQNLRDMLTANKWKGPYKYLNDDGTLSDNVKKVSTGKGGLYIYFIAPEVIPNMQRFLVYIGRAKKTAYQNLRKRVREYYDESIVRKREPKRARLKTLFNNWGKYVYFSFLELDNPFDDIKKLEELLIVSLMLPCNDEIVADYTVRAALAAF